MWQQVGMEQKPRIVYSFHLRNQQHDPWVVFVFEGAAVYPSFAAACKGVEQYYTHNLQALLTHLDVETQVIQ